MMPLQRACGAESQVRNKLSNGPLRAQSNVFRYRVFCDVWAYVSCRGYAGIPLSAQRHCCESRWHHGYVYYSSLTEREVSFCRGRFCFRQNDVDAYGG